ncbi:MAG: ATP-dependent Clp protease ATP-binding subunit [Prevotellaceae bacterium]|jgi:ATP-dependent Clp protease ATP-binding subunit ClpC|nr:ATP-dependent Clp protease ATP-binding subunit [Prevotellaceae bacterium]
METNYSQQVKEILQFSKEEAERLGNNYIGPEHLLLGILREQNSVAINLLNNFKVDLLRVKQKIESQIRTTNDVSNTELPLLKSTEKIMKILSLEMRALGDSEAGPEHLLLAILKDGTNFASEVLESEHVDYVLLRDFLKQERQVETITMFNGGGNIDDDEDNEAPIQKGKSPSSKTNSDTPVLDNFGIDLNKAAEEGRLDPVVGRETEIERLAQILSRRKKNNPVLIGEPGVGKSAIVEGLALRIVQRKVSRVLFEKRVVSLDVASIVAGTKYRGQFEERMKALLNELSKNPNVILFIDEIHTIVGAGSATGTLDAANMLKPALARGEIQCIGATTLDEYRQGIEKDGALERRFQKVIVEPTTAEDTLQILKNIKERYEEHHNVEYTEKAIEACVKLTDRYITDRWFPDKAIDALDEAGSRAHIMNISVPEEIEQCEKMLEDARQNKLLAVKNQNFEQAATYRDLEKNYIAKLDEEKRRWESNLKQNRKIVTEENVAEVVAMMSGVPIQRIAQAEGIKLLQMSEALQSKVIGQHEAVEKIVKAIQRSRVGLKDPNKPIGSFIFLGPTGVGKTHLAKSLAEFMFDSPDALIRVDMSEYMEKFSVTRLIGAPPGYVGYEEGGQLTEKVRRKPYSIVLLDEIEKAHHDVFNLLLQVLDEGHLTDGLGRKVDFKNTIIIMTSNVGTRQLKDFGKGVGFASPSASSEIDSEYAHGVLQKALNKTFSPEFLNRVDEVIIFDQLDKKALYQIIDLELKELLKRVANIGFELTITDAAKEFLAEKGYDVQFGARPLKRAIQRYVEDELSEIILKNTVVAGQTVVLDYDTENKKITTKIVDNN